MGERDFVGVRGVHFLYFLLFIVPSRLLGSRVWSQPTVEKLTVKKKEARRMKRKED